MFSARSDEQDENSEIRDEIKLHIDLNINQKLTQSDINNTNVRFQLEHQVLNQEMKESGWRVDKINSVTKHFYETTELNGSSYVKNPLRSSAILNNDNDSKYCFLWS